MGLWFNLRRFAGLLPQAACDPHEWCNAMNPAYGIPPIVCTRPKGHDGCHVSHLGGSGKPTSEWRD
jgi:hypothetical protein